MLSIRVCVCVCSRREHGRTNEILINETRRVNRVRQCAARALGAHPRTRLIYREMRERGRVSLKQDVYFEREWVHIFQATFGNTYDSRTSSFVIAMFVCRAMVF